MHLSRQEEFVLDVLESKHGGFYVELGAFHSQENSNTYNLENHYSWDGVSFEIEEDRRSEFNQNRRNPCFGDAITFKYIEYFESLGLPNRLDFLQVDIDNGGWGYNTRNAGLMALITVPLSRYRFNVITFEHDANMYFKNGLQRDVQREILDAFGYVLVLRDIHEDYWVDGTHFHIEQYRKYYHKQYQMSMQAFYQ